MSNETKTEDIIKIKETINKEDVEYIINTITYVRLWLVIFVIIIAIIIAKIILFKVVKTCKRAYIVHNERVIRQHNQATTQA